MVFLLTKDLIHAHLAGSILSKKPDLSIHKNTLVIQVQNEVISSGNTPLEDLIDVESQMYVDGKMIEKVDIKDVVVQKDGKNMILHYIVYDLWHFNKDSYINLKIQVFDGSFTGFVSAVFTNLETYSIKCIDKESEIFIPREQHGSCESWDSKIWVFGGKRTVSKKEVAMNDVMVYDAIKNSWKSIIPSSGQTPTPRFGHILFCYFQYLIVFGGQSESGKPLGDLWVFDTITEKWTFIMDTDDTHEFTHYDIEGYLPKARMFATGNSFHKSSAGFVSGGLTKDGVAWDIWILNFEKLALIVERDDKKLETVWSKMKIKEADVPVLCRQGHVSAITGEKEFVVYGGLDQNNKFVNTAYSFSINKLVTQLAPVGPTPQPRVRWGILSVGMGMVILYGGAHVEGKGYFVDLWHFVVKDDKIMFKQIDNTVEGDNLFMTWRHGFTMHNVRGEQDPILIGGTYGNNQQSQALVTLPEKKWANYDDLIQGVWSPWPYGSVFSAGAWKWWEHDQYFSKDEWKSCPLGLVGGNFGACVPCPGGTIYDYNYPSFWKQCRENEIWPMATRYAFPSSDFENNFEEVRLDSYPDLFNPHSSSFDYISVIVVFLLLFLSLVLATVIALLLSVYKEKSLFVFREIDIPFLTGGKRNVIGGILVLFYFLIVILIVLGFLLNFFFFNNEVVMFETKNPYLNKSYPSSYMFKVTLYTSNFMREQSSSSGENNIKTFDAPTPDLCKEHKIEVSLSR